MANIASAGKRARQSETRRKHNANLRSSTRTAIKKVLRSTEAKDLDTAKETFKKALPIIDRMVTKGIMHINKASRHKRQLNARVKALIMQQSNPN